MRRMMHAALSFLALSSIAIAQPPQLRVIQATPVASQSVLVSPSDHEHAEGAPQPEPMADASGPAAGGVYVPPPMMNYSNRTPHSQLGLYMQCSDYSPSLWAGYRCQRANEVACLNRHVDGRCGCLNGAHCLYAEASSCDSGCGSPCATGCGPRINRYASPGLSTLYAEPSSTCSNGLCGRPWKCSGCSNGGLYFPNPGVMYDANPSTCASCNGSVAAQVPTNSPMQPVSMPMAAPANQNRVTAPGSVRQTQPVTAVRPQMAPARR